MSHAVLTYHVRYPEMGSTPNELNGTQGKIVLVAFTMPCSVSLLGFRPATRDGQHKTLAPAAQIVADVANRASLPLPGDRSKSPLT